MKRLLVVVCVAVSTVSASAAALSGHISFVTKRGQNPVAEETLVWLEATSPARGAKKAPVTVQMTTRGKMLLPHVMAIPVGSSVSFPNQDPISHNIFSLTSGNQFDLGLYRTGAGKSHTFAVPGIVNVYCNVHPQMSAVIHVMATPYFAFANARGDFALTDVPAGKYDLVAWNEQGGTTRTAVDLAGTGTAAPVAVTLDSRSYRAMNHTNKSGKAYEPPRSREY
jgi:plastocyanin